MDEKTEVILFSMPYVRQENIRLAVEALQKIFEQQVVIINSKIETVTLEDLKQLVQSLSERVNKDE